MTLRVLITGARAPAALHLARLLHGAGHRVITADSLRWPLAAASDASAAYVRLPPANGLCGIYGTAIRDALRAHNIDLVIPTCEEIFYLAALWERENMPATLFAPRMQLLRSAHNKFAFVATAQSLDLAVPKTVLLQSNDDVSALKTPSQDLVFKPVWSRFATDVLVQPGNVLITPTAANPWVAQEFIAGQEQCVYAVAVKGRLVMLSSYQPTYRAGKGAGIAFKPIVDAGIRAFVERFVEGTAWHGQVSFDFIKRSDGTVVAIECNPRATSGIHFFDAPMPFANALLEGVMCKPEVTQTLGVKAAMLLYGPSQNLRGCWRDINEMADVIARPDDMRPARRQLLATLEFAAIALRNRTSLTQATTQDIAWNGD